MWRHFLKEARWGRDHMELGSRYVWLCKYFDRYCDMSHSFSRKHVPLWKIFSSCKSGYCTCLYCDFKNISINCSAIVLGFLICCIHLILLHRFKLVCSALVLSDSCFLFVRGKENQASRSNGEHFTIAEPEKITCVQSYSPFLIGCAIFIVPHFHYI